MHRIAQLTLGFFMVCAVSASAQTHRFEHQGETFEVRPFSGNDAFYEITYEEIRAFLGVPTDATEETPFGFATVNPSFDISPAMVTPEWLSGLGKCAGDDCFRLIGDAMLEAHRSWRAWRGAQQREREFYENHYQSAGEELRGLVEGLPAPPPEPSYGPELSYEHAYKGETFAVRALAGSECCFEVEYKGLKGYLGVPADEDPIAPYRYTLESTDVTAEGVAAGSSLWVAEGDSPRDVIAGNLNALCDALLQRHRMRQGFSPERAYHDLRRHLLRPER